jgi:N-acetyl-gamma-glutamylphosphate reductase
VWEEYSKFYMDEPFVRMIQAKDEGYTQLSLKNVIGTNFLDLLLLPSEKRILILSVLDNLMKGASGQAIQSMNLMLGFDEKSGLI